MTLDQYYMGRDKLYPQLLTDELRANAAVTVERATQLLARFGKERRVRSGWRPPQVNSKTAGAATRSNHLTCKAVDLEDADGKLDKFCMEFPEVLKEIGLWMEHPSATPGWCHIQTVPPKSGNRVFYP